MHIGAPEFLIVLVLVLIVFGPGRLPELGASLGKAIREFHKGKERTDEDPEDLNENDKSL
jgi:sec-independent protein translocase protein TatA